MVSEGTTERGAIAGVKRSRSVVPFLDRAVLRCGPSPVNRNRRARDEGGAVGGTEETTEVAW